MKMAFDYKFPSIGMPAYKQLDWNSVDVRGDDGLLHYGRVIDCADEGLVIDFGGGKTAQPILFGEIYRCKLERFKERSNEDTENLPVDALLRLHRGEPAKWYPGIVITGDFVRHGSFALTRIATPDGISAEIVSGERLREPRSGGELGQFLLEKGQFVKEEIQLPSGVSSGSPSPGPYKTAPADERLVECFNRNCSEHWMVATHIDGGVLHVLKITDRFRRKFDRDYRSSCPKLEGDTLFRMLGVTPPTPGNHPTNTVNAELGQDTKRANPPFSTPSGFFRAGPAPPTVSAIPPTGVPPFCGFYAAPVFSGVFQPRPTAPLFRPRSTSGACHGSFSRPFTAPSFYGQPPLRGGPFGQPRNPSAARFSDPSRSPSFSRQSPLHGGCFGQSFFSYAYGPETLPPMNKVLPKEILVEIFEYVEGVPQTELRRVCSKWNQILTTVPGNRMLRVSEDRMFGWTTMPRVCLLKRWTAQTRVILYTTIANTDSMFGPSFTDFRDRFDKQHYGTLMCSAHLFRCICQIRADWRFSTCSAGHTASTVESQLPRLDALVLAGIGWQQPWNYIQRSGHFSNLVINIRDELNSFASVCRTLVLKDVTVVLAGDKMPVAVRIMKGRITEKLSVDGLWSLMDKSLPRLRDADLACWTEWMSDNSDDALPDQLVEILNERQSADPRDSSLFRGKEWMRDDLVDLDLEELNRITAHSLLKACCYEKLVLPLNW